MYARFVTLIYRYFYSRLGNQEEAEDLTSDVFLKAVRQLDPGRDEASSRAWLYQTARTTLADYWRRRHRLDEQELGDIDVPEPEPAAAPDALAAQEAHRLLGQLPDRYREVLELRFIYGYSIQETARAMGITTNHAKVLQYRAVRHAATLRREHERSED